MEMPRPFSFVSQNAALREDADGRHHWAADAAVLAAMVVLLWLIYRVSQQINAPFDQVTAPSTVSTDPWNLPYFALRSLVRMFAALFASVVFTFIYATIAARSRRAGKILIPILDVLQSVPVLGFLSITLTIWLTLFPRTALGVEMASIFAIFTSQVWNMTFAFYQSLITEPKDLDEAARLMRLSKWQRFWRLDVPNGIMPLVWNGMMSFGGGWFFLIASEVIAVNNHTFALPGIGSYVAAASDNQQIGRLLLAIVTMILMVVAVNVLFWRPLTAWAERFRTGDTSKAVQQRSVVLDVVRRSIIPGIFISALRPIAYWLERITKPFGLADPPLHVNETRRKAGDWVFNVVVIALIVYGLIRMLIYINNYIGLSQFLVAAGLGLITFARVLVMLLIATIIFVPLGVWIGLNPKVTRFAQPIVQVLASFPANFLFPFITMFLLWSHISLGIGGIFLMALGAQWYILFNVMAGAQAIPNDMLEAADSLRLTKWQRWRYLYGPAVFSSWVTGALTAAGGAWNASIVAEVVSYGGTHLVAPGLGSYIAESTAQGDFARTLVGVVVMSIFVVGLNRLLWNRLYEFAEKRFALT